MRRYDFDSDPKKRKDTPHFYGYLPDNGTIRLIMYVSMVFNSALLLLLRSLSAALLMTISANYLIAYMVADIALYLTQKCIRNDFHHWIPVEGFPGLVFSFLVRVILKVSRRGKSSETGAGRGAKRARSGKRSETGAGRGARPEREEERDRTSPVPRRTLSERRRRGGTKRTAPGSQLAPTE